MVTAEVIDIKINDRNMTFNVKFRNEDGSFERMIDLDADHGATSESIEDVIRYFINLFNEWLGKKVSA